MVSKQFLSWPRRQAGPEPSNRSGRETPTLKAEKRRPSRLAIVQPDDNYASSPLSSHYDSALASAVSNLQTAINDIQRSPASTITTFSRAASVFNKHKPLPRRPRSTSVFLATELPAEVPDSVVSESQAQSQCLTPASTKSTTRFTRHGSHVRKKALDYGKTTPHVPSSVMTTLAHARSVPELRLQYSGKIPPTSDTPVPAVPPQSDLTELEHNGLSAESDFWRHPKSDLAEPFSSVGGNDYSDKDSRSEAGQVRLDAANEQHLAPRPIERKPSGRKAERRLDYSEVPSSRYSLILTESYPTYELESPGISQHQTAPPLQAQVASLKVASEAHANNLVRSHSMGAASLRNQVRLFRKQLTRSNLQDTSSSDYRSGKSSIEIPRTDICESDQKILTSTEPVDWNPSFRSELAERQSSFDYSETNPVMESFRRKLCTSRKQEAATSDLQTELNLYIHNNAALQKQIESLMAKLNESKKNERDLRNTLGMTEMKSAEWEDKARHTDKLAESVQGLQNTIANLESRLEVANARRLDAEEQLSNLRNQKSPFDFTAPKVQLPLDLTQSNFDPNISTSTVISSTPGGTQIISSDNSTLAVLAAQIEQLQSQVRDKDACIAELENNKEQLQQKYELLEHEHQNVAVQSDLQYQLLQETRGRDRLIEQLRTAVIDRESTIMQSEETIQSLRKQLEYHKLLLQAEIRRHAAMKLYVGQGEDPLPELFSIAKKEDIDSWMDKLHERLKAEQAEREGKTIADAHKAQIDSLRQEIDFYVREIILFKLDIKGYRSDIRKLKRMTTQVRSSEIPSDTTSLLGSLATPTIPEGDEDARSHADAILSGGEVQPSLGLQIPKVSLNPARNGSYEPEVDRIDSAVSTTPNTPPVSEPPNPSRVSSVSGKRRDFAKDFPPRSLHTIQEVLQSHKRGMSETSLDVYQQPVTTDESTITQDDTTTMAKWNAMTHKGRSTSTSDAPTWPPRSQVSVPQLPPRSNSVSDAVTASPSDDDSRDTTTDSRESSSRDSVDSTASSVLSTASEYFAQSIIASDYRPSKASAPRISVDVALGPLQIPGLVGPAPIVLATGCSITRNMPLSTAPTPPTSQMGIGGTMASSTPVTSPISKIKVPEEVFPPRRGSNPKKTPLASMSPPRASQAAVISGPEETESPGRPSTPPRQDATASSSVYSPTP